MFHYIIQQTFPLDMIRLMWNNLIHLLNIYAFIDSGEFFCIFRAQISLIDSPDKE